MDKTDFFFRKKSFSSIFPKESTALPRRTVSLSFCIRIKRRYVCRESFAVCGKPVKISLVKYRKAEKQQTEALRCCRTRHSRRRSVSPLKAKTMRSFRRLRKFCPTETARHLSASEFSMIFVEDRRSKVRPCETVFGGRRGNTSLRALRVRLSSAIPHLTQKAPQ